MGEMRMAHYECRLILFEPESALESGWSKNKYSRDYILSWMEVEKKVGEPASEETR